MFKARMKFAKEGRARYISHLDLMHTMQRAMARCEMPLWFTEGFNQHAYVSVALPLSTGFSGEWELLDFNLLSESVPVNAVEAMNDVFPEGLRALEIYPLSDGGMPVREQNRALLRSLGCVVYLSAGKQTILERVKKDGSRPMLEGGSLEERVERLMREREGYYRQAAHIDVRTDGRSIRQVLQIISQETRKYGVVLQQSHDGKSKQV